jgi:hypothetical protein
VLFGRTCASTTLIGFSDLLVVVAFGGSGWRSSHFGRVDGFASGRVMTSFPTFSNAIFDPRSSFVQCGERVGFANSSAVTKFGDLNTEMEVPICLRDMLVPFRLSDGLVDIDVVLCFKLVVAVFVAVVKSCNVKTASNGMIQTNVLLVISSFRVHSDNQLHLQTTQIIDS